jgi:hypothetical protein
MKMADLQERFPSFTIRSEAESSCPVCKGSGIVQTKSSMVPERPCLCVCLSDDCDTPSRSELAESLQRTIAKIRHGSQH